MHCQLSGKAAAGSLHMVTGAECLSMTVTLQLALMGGGGGGAQKMGPVMSLLLFAWGQHVLLQTARCCIFASRDQCACGLCKMHKGKQDVTLHLVIDPLQKKVVPSHAYVTCTYKSSLTEPQ